ncbi:MAG: OmpA family protein [Flavobacteriales bacterium]
MNRYFLALIFMGISLVHQAQWNYNVAPVSGLNTQGNEIACGRYNEGLIVTSNGNLKSKGGRSWNESGVIQLFSIEKTSDFSLLKNAMPLTKFKGPHDDGTASYNPLDSMLYFSTSNDIIGKKSTFIQRIYQCKWNGQNWSVPEMLPFCEGNFVYTHPWFDAERNLLVFSSDRKGGQGGMDIWYVYKTENGWTIPANCGGQVNTSASEVFPSCYNGDIYFSSNGWIPERGFELFKSEENNQWMNAIQLDAPLNSDGDDLMIVFLQDDRGLISSARTGGLGGADVYLFNRVITKIKANDYAGLLECKGMGLPFSKVEVYNQSDELVEQLSADASGKFNLENLSLEEKYTMRLVGINAALFEHCVLYLLDENGNRIRQWQFNAKGEIELELLRFVYSSLPLANNPDPSVLNMAIEGEVKGKTGSVSVARIPISIIDEQGEIVAMTYTDRLGSFRFEAVTPQQSYVFRLSGSSKIDQVIVFNNGKRIALPVMKQEAYYKRVSDEEAIELVDESGKKVVISTNDVFIINRVYYDYNSTSLSNITQGQLDQLLVLLKQNPDVQIEMTAHTDSRGTNEYNQDLSMRRAQAVVAYLKKRGVNENRVAFEGKGESDPLYPCDFENGECSESDHALNRRTEIRFVKNLVSYHESDAYGQP